ncbi:MAG: barstar family protein [Alphaproteobacteria bacterium]|nr:barstar family protein [Alphaproteobacteria bacterium]
MKTVMLDAGLPDKAAALARIGRELGLGEVAPRNLDALWDVLRGDVRGPFAIVWTDHARASVKLGADFDALCGLLRRLAEERRDFTFTLA